MIVIRLIARGITTQRQDIAHSRSGVSFEDGSNLLMGVSHTGQVRHGIQRGARFQPQDKIVREIPG